MPGSGEKKNVLEGRFFKKRKSEKVSTREFILMGSCRIADDDQLLKPIRDLIVWSESTVCGQGESLGEN